MKKFVVMMIAVVLIATPAFAAVRNSKHDLSLSSSAIVKATGGADEVCVFCHTPHGGATGTGILAPLWNRSIPGGGLVAGDLYNSATLDQTNSNPTNVVAAVNLSDAPLCLSCHDGGSIEQGLTNPANTGGQPTGPALVTGVTGFMNITGGGAGDGSMLRNDHPIGMNYSAVFGAVANEFNTSSGSYPNEVVSLNGNSLPLYTSNGVMWCSSCHDVHAQGGFAPFLNMSNAGSALCTTCHIK